MLVESSLSSSFETSLLNVSEYQDTFAAYDWVLLAETYQMIHKSPEQDSQVGFIEAVPVTSAMNLNESKHPILQVRCAEKSVMPKVSEKALTSLVYSRRKRSEKPVGTADHNLGKDKKNDDPLDDSIVHSGESTKRKNRFNNCLVYSRKKRRGKPSCHFTGETTVRSDGLDNVFVSENDSRETKRSNRLDNCLVYTRKKGNVKFSCTEHLCEGTKICTDHTESSAYSQRRQTAKAGSIKNSGCQHVYSQSKQLLKFDGSFAESHSGDTKRNGDKSGGLLMYSRRKKQRGKSIGARVNGFLVYSRRNPKVKSRGTFTGQVRSALELVDDTQLTFSDGGSDSCSSLKSSSQLASSSRKSREDETKDCCSSDAVVSETDTDGSSSPLRQCKYCDKPGTAQKMLVCDKCEEAYHTSCCGVRMKEVEDIDDWLCPSCSEKHSLKTKIKRRISRNRKLRATKPFVIGIRIGKEFQADVPDWSGPIMSNTSFVGEPLEIDESEYMHNLKKKNGKKPCYAVNWLQCREEDVDGDICGKWRRAPRSEVQTKDWECFCCVFWDPSRADCSVPQELETSEILKQLKYIKMLRPRSDTKRKKLGPKGRSRSHNKGKS